MGWVLNLAGMCEEKIQEGRGIQDISLENSGRFSTKGLLVFHVYFAHFAKPIGMMTSW